MPTHSDSESAVTVKVEQIMTQWVGARHLNFLCSHIRGIRVGYGNGLFFGGKREMDLGLDQVATNSICIHQTQHWPSAKWTKEPQRTRT